MVAAQGTRRPARWPVGSRGTRRRLRRHGVPLAASPDHGSTHSLGSAAPSRVPNGWGDAAVALGRIGPRATVAAGWSWYALSYAGLATAAGPRQIAAWVLVYGVHHGLSEAGEKKLVARLVGADRRGRAFGAYHLTVGLAALPASLGFGVVWQTWGAGLAFGAAAALALAAAAALLALVPTDPPRAGRAPAE